MTYIESSTTSNLINDIDTTLSKYCKQFPGELDFNSGVLITFSQYNPDTKQIFVYVNTAQNLGIDNTDKLVRINLEDLSVDMERYIPDTPDATFTANKAREFIKQSVPNIARENKLLRSTKWEIDERAVPLMAMKRYILESQGEFFNIVKKEIGREITTEEIVAIIENSKRFLDLDN